MAMLTLPIRNRPQWTQEATFLDFCEGHGLTYDAVVEANLAAAQESRGLYGGPLAISYGRFLQQELNRNVSVDQARENAILAVARLAQSKGKSLP